MNDRRLAAEQRRCEERDHAGVRRARVLPGPEHVEVSRRHGRKPVQVREHLAILLAHQFLQRVRRQRPRGHVLVLGQRRRVPVRGGRAGVDQPFHTGRARGDQDVQRRGDVGAVRGRGVVHGPRHGGNCRLMEHVVHARRSLCRHVCVRQIPFDELSGLDAGEVGAFARDQAVDDADAVPAAQELFRQVGADEAGATGYQVRSH